MAADLSALFQGAKPQGMMAGMEEGMNQANIISEIANRGTSAAMNEAMAGQYRASTNSMQQKLPYELNKMQYENSEGYRGLQESSLKAKTKLDEVNAMAEFQKLDEAQQKQIVQGVLEQNTQMAKQATVLGSQGRTGADAVNMIRQQMQLGYQNAPAELRPNIEKQIKQFEETAPQLMSWTPQQLMEWGKKTLETINSTSLEAYLAKINGQNQVRTAAAGGGQAADKLNIEQRLTQLMALRQSLQPGSPQHKSVTTEIENLVTAKQGFAGSGQQMVDEFGNPMGIGKAKTQGFKLDGEQPAPATPQPAALPPGWTQR